MNTLTEDELKDFENEVRICFKNKEIHAPVHLSDGNEKQLKYIFTSIKDNDWICCSWRAHYECLLKGVPKDVLLRDIKNGKSMSLCYPEYKIFSSSIVGGIIPIATGLALSIKMKKETSNVYCFIGDMTSETGCFHENYKYSLQHDLPVYWVISDNNRSVCTDTRKVWNMKTLTYEYKIKDKLIYYKYEPKFPHVGVGERITF